MAAPLTVPPARPLTYLEVRSIIWGMMLAMFLAALNQTIVATALPTIGHDFNDFENLPWVVTAFLLTSTAVAPLYGKLSDIYGRRTMLLTGLGLFTAGKGRLKSIYAAIYILPLLISTVLIVGRSTVMVRTEPVWIALALVLNLLRSSGCSPSLARAKSVGTIAPTPTAAGLVLGEIKLIVI